LESDAPTLAVLERLGATPLPPYIRKQRRKLHEPEVTPADQQRYNTVYARDAGSVAAPTAGLHFTPGLLARLDAMGVRRAFVTLHVGLGTFAPVRSQRVEEHDAHREWLTIPAATLQAVRHARAANRRVIVVGTTTVRAMESLPADWVGLPADQEFVTETGLLISPGPAGEAYPFRFTDSLMTNFHLPRSTLLALVAALPNAGITRVKQWYATAVEQGYRFYSYGDAMWIAP
jgi:S-adenosylmethionine:tRNA ribosyltransferase-isomerase